MSKNLLITGAASGIGKASFNAINKDGFDNIILVDIDPIEVTTPNTFAYQCDISNQKEVSELFKNLRSKDLYISCAINAAGVPGPNKPFVSSTIDEFDRIIGINLRGTFMMMKYQLEDMTKLKAGKVINIASVLASCGMSGSSYYSASKAGIVALTKSLAIEYAEKNIQINCISPGGVDTNFVAKLKERIGIETLNNIHPTKKIADADEIAVYIKFLVENATSFMTGSEIFIDGGYSAQ